MGAEESQRMIALLRGLKGQLRHAADRARHGRGVRARRPHHRAGLRPRSSPAARPTRSAPTRTCAQAYLGEEAALMLRVDGPRRLLRREPGAVRHGAARRRRRGRDPDGPQRHGQDDDRARHHGPAAGAAAAPIEFDGAARRPACPPSASPGSASASCRRAGRSSPTCRCDENLVAASANRAALPALDPASASTSSSRGWPSASATWATSSRAASSRCWRSAAR